MNKDDSYWSLSPFSAFSPSFLVGLYDEKGLVRQREISNKRKENISPIKISKDQSRPTSLSFLLFSTLKSG